MEKRQDDDGGGGGGGVGRRRAQTSSVAASDYTSGGGCLQPGPCPGAPTLMFPSLETLQHAASIGSSATNSTFCELIV